MPDDEKTIRIEMLDEFDHELSRGGGETPDVPADLADHGIRISLDITLALATLAATIYSRHWRNGSGRPG